MRGPAARTQHTRSTVLRREAPASAAAAQAPPTGERTIPVVASTDDVDFYDEVVDQASWRLARFARNPVALYQHDRRCDPIGYYRDVRVDDGGLKATLVLYDDATSPEAGRVWRRYCQGGPVPLSVGFSCKRTKTEERAGKKVRVLLDCELEEISVVTIPANPQCVAEARVKGIALYRHHRALAAHHRRNTTPMNALAKLLAAKGMTPEDFAAKAGLSADDMTALAAGDASDEVKTKAAGALEMELDDLVDALLDGEEGEGEPPPVVEAAKGKGARGRKGATGASPAEVDELLRALGAKSVGEAVVKAQALKDAREEQRGNAARLKSLEASVREQAESSEKAARAAVLQKYRELGVLTPAREKGKVGAQLAKYSKAADVDAYLDTLDPVADAAPAARQPEGGGREGLSEKQLAEMAAETGIPVEKLKASAKALAERPAIR